MRTKRPPIGKWKYPYSESTEFDFIQIVRPGKVRIARGNDLHLDVSLGYFDHNITVEFYDKKHKEEFLNRLKEVLRAKVTQKYYSRLNGKYLQES